MPTEIRKPANIFKDCVRFFATNRAAQLGVVVLIVAAVAALLLTRAISARIDEANAKAQVEERDKEKKAAFIQSIVRFPVAGESSNSAAVGIDLSSIQPDLQNAVSERVGKLLADHAGNTTILPDALLPAFYTNGHFSAVNAGDVRILEEIDFFDRIPRLILVSPQVQFSDSASVAGMKTCRLSVSARGFRAGGEPGTVRLNGTGVGFTDAASTVKAFQSISEDEIHRLRTLFQ